MIFYIFKCKNGGAEPPLALAIEYDEENSFDIVKLLIESGARITDEAYEALDYVNDEENMEKIKKYMDENKFKIK